MNGPMIKALQSSTEHEARRIAYELIEGGPQRVVLISGTGLPGAYWTIAQTPAFRSWATCLLIDNAGSGGTYPLLDGTWSVQQMSIDVLTVMDAVGWDSAHLVGHSLGSVIATAIAASSPSRVQSLSLHSTWPGARRAPHVRAWLEARQNTARVGDPVLWMKYAFLLVGPQHFAEHGMDGGGLGEIANLIAATGSIAHVGQYDAGIGYEPCLPLEDLSVPVLVTAGSQDFVTLPEHGRLVADLVPGARFVEFSGAGHLAALEVPEVFNTVQDDFIRSIGRP